MAGKAQAEEIEPFKLTGIDGYATVQYLSDEQTTRGVGGAGSRQAQTGWRSELFSMTHSYIYHPNLLTLDIGGGPILTSQSYAGDTGSGQDRSLLFNFSAQANFLRDKPYTGSLFYSHLNPTVSVAPGQVFTQENVRYGFDFSLLAPATSVPLHVNFVHTQSSGQGADRFVDDNSDQFNVTATRSFGALGYTQVQFQSGQQYSRSGSLDLPIQSSKASTLAFNADTRLQFGSNREYDLTNVISINEQRYALGAGNVPPHNDVRFMLDGRARHSDSLHTYALYNYGNSSQGTIGTVNQSASAGLSYWPTKGIEAAVGARIDNTDAQQFQTRVQGLDGSIRYERELPLGSLQAGYGAHYEQREQLATAAQTPVIGELLTLSGSTYMSLGHPHVVAGTLIVSNANRSQIFVSGIDYSVLTVGNETRIQRLIGGSILDGEQILVDYSYDVGGSYGYNQFDQTANLSWNLSRYVNAYVRIFNSRPRLTSGLPTFPLNEVRTSMVGVRADLPFNIEIPMTTGGGIEAETRDETIAPYRRMSADAYIQTDEPIFDLGNFRASIRRARIDYGIAAQNSDVTGHELRFWSRNWFGLAVTAALSTERDDAGLLPRRRNDGAIGVQWQERKFSLTSSLVHTRETQGGVERSRASLQILARREL